jgi:F-type H+-transporting ATPase subunit c
MDGVNWVKAAAYLSAGICMGVGAIGPALGQGFAGGKACEAISNSPESYKDIRTILMFALVFVESSSIYALVVSLMLIFFT